jgi:putative FmdB family regulatory protein
VSATGEFCGGFSQPANWNKFGVLREATMPVYDYICHDCQKEFELVLTLGEHNKGDIRCPKCNSKNVEQDAVAFFVVTSKKS